MNKQEFIDSVNNGRFDGCPGIAWIDNILGEDLNIDQSVRPVEIDSMMESKTIMHIYKCPDGFVGIWCDDFVTKKWNAAEYELYLSPHYIRKDIRKEWNQYLSDMSITMWHTFTQNRAQRELALIIAGTIGIPIYGRVRDWLSDNFPKLQDFLKEKYEKAME